MPAKTFFDTNVLIYAFAANEPKAAIAQHHLANGGVISVQVLNEFANVCRRKLSLDWSEIDERIAVLCALLDEPMPITAALHDAARKLAREHQMGFYDALIVVSAQASGARALLTEDMQHARKYGDLTILNPFAGT